MQPPVDKNNQRVDQQPQTLLNTIKAWYHDLPDKKRYVEFITAILTVPVLLTVLVTNLSNIRSQSKPAVTTTPEPTQKSSVTIIQYPSASSQTNETLKTTPSLSPTPNGQCTPSIGPVKISYPQEQDVVSGNPVCIDISGSGSPYCAVVWSYRINGGAWSNYTGDNICMYGLPPGDKTLDLRVKSTVTGDETMLTRHFTVVGDTQTPTPATSSGTLQ